MPTLLTNCVFCGKPLKATPCQTCKGSGKVNAPRSGSQTCEVCKGQGRLLLCPDWSSHLTGKTPESRPLKTPKIPPMKIPRPVQRCPMCGGTGGIRHPFTGQAGPCPRCGGKGVQ